MGDELTAVLDAIENDKPYSAAEKSVMKLGVHVLPKFTRDTTDRNRTSPFAFTGNKFEFRMPGSSDSIACANIMLNAAVSESLKFYADKLEGAKDFEAELHDLIKDTIKEHKRIIFNGNGYDDEWLKEAEKRGLLNLRTTPDALPELVKEKNVKMLTAHKVYSATELDSRYEALLENYCKAVLIEARTMVDMANTDILPSVSAFSKKLGEAYAAKKAVSAELECKYEKSLISELSALLDDAACDVKELSDTIEALAGVKDYAKKAEIIKDSIIPEMAKLRKVCDKAETLTSEKYWPFPTYGKLLFGVR